MRSIKLISLVLIYGIIASCQQGWINEELGNEIEFQSGAWTCIESRWDNYDGLTIFSKVESYDFNDNFIIIAQKPDFKSYKMQYADIVIFNKYYKYEEYLNDSLFYTKNSYFPKEYLSALKKDSVIYNKLKSENYSDQYTSEDRQIRASIADSIIRNDPYHKKIFSQKINYWIIDKGKMKLLGPYTKEEFYQKRKELGVSEDLEFDEGEYN